MNGIVAHITSSDASDWQQALRNLSNLYQSESVATPPNLITVVINGGAVRFVRAESPEAKQVTRIAESGVDIKACKKSFERLGYDTDELAAGVSVIDSGVAEVIRLQQNNDGYLKLP